MQGDAPVGIPGRFVTDSQTRLVSLLMKLFVVCFSFLSSFFSCGVTRQKEHTGGTLVSPQKPRVRTHVGEGQTQANPLPFLAVTKPGSDRCKLSFQRQEAEKREVTSILAIPLNGLAQELQCMGSIVGNGVAVRWEKFRAATQEFSDFLNADKEPRRQRLTSPGND